MRVGFRAGPPDFSINPLSMEKTLKILGILALIGGVGYFIFSKVAAKVYAEDVKMKITRSSFSELIGQVLITVKNKLGASIPVQSFNGKLYYGNYIIADLKLNNTIQVATGTSTVVPIDFEVGYLDMAANVVNILQSGSYLYPFSVKGTLVLEGITIPINQKIDVI